ncbi:hypothetical protein DMENIID0001_063470 [Sergentomyia squamirostris]
MPKATIVLENVPKDDKSFVNYVPREGRKRYNALKTNHPTPFVYVDYDNEQNCQAAIETINRHYNNGEIPFTAKRFTDKDNNRSNESLEKDRKMPATRVVPPKTGFCILCQGAAELMCERCFDPYCSQKCQRDHWKYHRPMCKRMPSLISYLPFEEIIEQGLNTVSQGLMQSSLDFQSGNSLEEDSIDKSGTLNGRLQSHQKNGYSSPKKIPEEPPSRTVSSSSLEKTPNAAPKVSPVLAADLRVPEDAPKISSTPPRPAEVRSETKKTLQDIPRGDIPDNGAHVVPLHFTKNTSPVQVFLRSSKTDEIFQKIAKLGMKYGKILPALEEYPIVSGIYLGAYEEEGIEEWYRVIVRAVHLDRNCVSVAYIDFGNQGEISFDKLKEIPDEMIQLPRVTFRVTLHGVPHIPNEEKFNKYKDQLTSRILLMNYDGPKKIIDSQVTLYDLSERKRCLNLYFTNAENVELPSAFPQGSKKFIFTKDSIMMKNFTVIEDTKIVIHLDDTLEKTALLYCCLAEDVSKNSEIEMRAEEICQKNPEPYKPKIGELCFGKWNDNAWYRVLIIHYDDEKDEYLAKFIDYGNYGTIRADNIRVMVQELTQIESTLILASVDGIDGPWPLEKIEKFREIYAKTSGIISVKKIEFKKGQGVLHIPDILKQL